MARVPGLASSPRLPPCRASATALRLLLVRRALLQARPEHVKPRLLRHWATTPGLNLLYAHPNRVITARDLDLLRVTSWAWTRSGQDASTVRLPARGRAPGRDAGVVAAARSAGLPDLVGLRP